MVSLKNKSKGFTIVELLIVIVVIGILATLVLITFTGIQQKARDSKRKTDLGAVQAALETYYSSNNSYPLASELESTTWQKANMKGFDPAALADPKLPSADASTPLQTGAGDDTHYGYKVVESDGTTACTTSGNCTDYTITAHLEGGGTFSKQSNNN